MKITVTQEDIDNGCQYSPSRCPIANAVQREFPEKWISVSTQVICVFSLDADDYDSRKFVITGKARKFISQYDHGGIADPTTFTFREVK